MIVTTLFTYSSGAFMNWLNFDLRKTIWLAAVLSIPLISINTQKTPFDSGWFNRPFSFLAGAVEGSFFSFSDNVRQTVRLYVNLVGVKRDFLEIQQASRNLQAQLQLMDELRTENERLNKLLDFKNRSKMQLIAARVMSRDILEDHSTIQIDKGTQSGLKNGQAVITVNGVVGHVFRPDAFHSHILLVNDRFSVVDGIVSRSRARGIVEGKSSSSCLFRYVEKSEDVKPGDTIVTSGLDNIFPKGFPIAIVESVENKPYAVSLKVELKPVVDPNKIEEVYIIVDAANEDHTPPTEKKESPVTPEAVRANI